MLLLAGELPLRRAACWNRERKMLLLGELPLRGAARLREGGSSVSSKGGCRRAGLLDYRKEDAASGESPAARGCWNI